jgi:hypothetical protein
MWWGDVPALLRDYIAAHRLRFPVQQSQKMMGWRRGELPK